MKSNLERYRILTTYDLPLIEQRLGLRFYNLSEVHRAVREAYAALSQEEVAEEERALEAEGLAR